MMMPGSASAHAPSTSAWTTSRAVALGGGLDVLLARTSHHQATASLTPIRIPGTMPARKSFEIDKPGGDAEDDEADATAG